MQLDAEQRKVATKLIRRGRRDGASKKDILTALATGLTEASLRNPRGGEGTSAGWRQEISSYGSVRNRTNVARSADRFYRELRSAPRGSIGQRAQAVQRSAFPGRYAEHVGEARQILRQLGGKVGRSDQAGSSGLPRLKATGGKTRLSSQTQTNQIALRQARLGLVHNLDLTGEKKPDFTKFTDLKAQEQAATTTSTAATTSPRIRASGGGRQKESLTPVDKTSKAVNVPHTRGKAIKIGSRLADRLGLTVTSTTGGTHVAGSYHYQGRAVDISGSPAQMRRLFLKLRKYRPTELFYDPMGYYYKNGQRVHGAIGGHSDHVHFAL